MRASLREAHASIMLKGRRAGMGVAVLMLVYALAEAIALLMGFSVLPPFSGCAGYALALGVVVGALTERILPARARKYVMANAYALPLVAGECGWVAGWLNILSILLFAALLARVIYLRLARTDERTA